MRYADANASYKIVRSHHSLPTKNYELLGQYLVTLYLVVKL
ncbi:hypothetical protein PN488_21955 [Nodularia spumigena CS-591/12]|nr:hypothetical protein [Nodularia spumigena]MDB9306998.1 hypothetical protein [Nodularia spumigena CS-591/12]MDB9345366.1 hypothetical protein [Nodularia spumigena CS-588/06]MDB9349510.1 hypothetical protein [Nodularia spumigena CS-588/01]MDB9351686.1 hypothetical protein [Nodularia spumigena CS-588/05]MDB9369783.1 hypothetical protein [Nodularia spumigena CS-586/05]